MTSPTELIKDFLLKGPPDIRGGAELFRWMYPIGTIIHYTKLSREVVESTLAQMIESSDVTIVINKNSTIKINDVVDETHYKYISEEPEDDTESEDAML